jgi:hypothetical protein
MELSKIRITLLGVVHVASMGITSSARDAIEKKKAPEKIRGLILKNDQKWPKTGLN